MNQKNDLSLSLSGDAFSALRSDFDQVLRSTLAGMIDTDQDTAEVSMKVKITLTEDSAPDYSVAGGQHTREITKPKFEHTVTAVIQRKEKKTGTFSGEYELVLDRETGKYVARPIDNGQTTLFDVTKTSVARSSTQTTRWSMSWEKVREGSRRPQKSLMKMRVRTHPKRQKTAFLVL